MIKTLNKLGIERNFLSLIEAILEKPKQLKKEKEFLTLLTCRINAAVIKIAVSVTG